MSFRIPAPNYTKAPNDLFDHWLPLLGEGELKVLLVILRKTFGWHKVRDEISLSQLAEITGMHEETVVRATKSLQAKGLIIKQVTGLPGRQKTTYELVVTEDSNKSYPSDQQRGPLGSDGPVPTEAQKKVLTKEKSVCIDESNGTDKKQEKTNTPEMQQIRRINKKNGRGADISLGWDELVTHAISWKKDWDLLEMQEAWKILHERNGFVNDMIEFIGGTITNLRTKTRSTYANKGKPTCKSQQTKKVSSETKSSTDISNSSRKDSAEKGTRVSILECLTSLQNEAKQFRTGSTTQNAS